MVSKTAKKWLIRLVILIAIIEIIALLIIWVAVKFGDPEAFRSGVAKNTQTNETFLAAVPTPTGVLSAARSRGVHRV
jgi:hypothetical protein